MITHKCIKCQTEYKDNDPDDYYCKSCEEIKNKIAKEVDKKMAGKVSKNIKSDLQIFDELRKSRGSKFINIKDLGISLQ